MAMSFSDEYMYLAQRTDISHQMTPLILIHCSLAHKSKAILALYVQYFKS